MGNCKSNKVVVFVVSESEMERKLYKIHQELNLGGPDIYLGAIFGSRVNAYVYEISAKHKLDNFQKKIKQIKKELPQSFIYYEIDDVGTYYDKKEMEKFILGAMKCMAG